MQTREDKNDKAAKADALKKGFSRDVAKSTIKCECGWETLLIPDLKAMSKTIEAHVDTHRKIEKDCSKTDAENIGAAELEAERVENYLVAQVLKKASTQKS
jgi:hypothetical protein